MSEMILQRTVLKIAGDDRAAWLEGLITNTLATPITFAALLTPQGKIIADFFVHDRDDHWLLETPVKFGELLYKRLRMYMLRANVNLDLVDMAVRIDIHATDSVNRAYLDPRHVALGTRELIAAPAKYNHEHSTAYDLHRLGLSIPDSEWDFDTAETFPANMNMDLLNGVNFKKGCFVGQEVVSRMHRKTVVRKRLGAFQSTRLPTQTKITALEREVGQIVHTNDAHTNNTKGMALWRHDRLESTSVPLMAGDSMLTPLGWNYADTQK